MLGKEKAAQGREDESRCGNSRGLCSQMSNGDAGEGFQTLLRAGRVHVKPTNSFQVK